jgi:DNA invertase Pin-like site-specific DNA recombinase
MTKKKRPNFSPEFRLETAQLVVDNAYTHEDAAKAMLGGIYQFERSMMLERQREGIAIAKLKGKYKGKPINIELNENICALAKLGTNKSQIAKQLNCSRTTVYKALSN